MKLTDRPQGLPDYPSEDICGNGTLTLASAKKHEELVYRIHGIYDPLSSRAFIPTPKLFKDIFNFHVQKEICDKSYSVRRLFSKYISEENKEVWFLGTAFYVGQKNASSSHHLLTARHNVRWTRDYEGTPYKLLGVYISKMENASRIECENSWSPCYVLTTKSLVPETQHDFPNYEKKWEHITDYALLECKIASTQFYHFSNDDINLKIKEKVTL
jgi:hypothetical protein